MTEEELLYELFVGKKWKDKYFVKWCDLCETAYISCLDPDCHGSSCNCGGCDKCLADFKEFNACKTTVYSYLTEEEIKIYDKCLRIKKHILETLPHGNKEIDWKKLQSEGQLSLWEENLFEKELKL